MTSQARKNINIIIPALIAGYVGYKQFEANQDPKRTAIFTAFSLLIAYAIVSSITGGIKRAKDTEILNEVPADPKYNPAPLANSLFQDIYEYFGLRDKQIYYEFAGLTDAQFVQVARYWNDNFYFKDKETLKQAINGEVLGIELSPVLDNINARFNNLKLN